MTEREFIAMSLANDEVSTDAELVEHWISEGVAAEAAAHYIAQRDRFLMMPMPSEYDLIPYQANT